MPEREPAVVKATPEDMTGVEPAGTHRRTAAAKAAAMNGHGSTMEAAVAHAMTPSAMASSAMTSTTMTAAAMAAADFGRQPIGDVFRCGRGSRVDQRKRLRALIRRSGQHQRRPGRKAEATNKAALRTLNFHHACTLRESATKAVAVQRPALGT
jgi:hypothetical protein